MTSIGFMTDATSTCSFSRKDLELHVSVHGGDFTVMGPDEELIWLEKRMKAKYEIKSEHLGPGAHHQQKKCSDLCPVSRYASASQPLSASSTFCTL